MVAIMPNGNLICKFLCIIFAIAISVVSCQEQTLHQQQQQQQQLPPLMQPQPQPQPQHQLQPAHVTVGTRWNRRQHQPFPTSSPSCDYKELLSNLHDRVSILASLDEDQRSRLEAMSKKIVQFETSNLARLDSLNVRQMDFLKRLDSMELLQRMTKRQMEELRDFLEDKTKANEQNDNNNNNNKEKSDVRTEVNNDLSAQRHIRDVPQLQSSNNYVPSLSEADKLDALSTLLVSTRSALNTLQTTLESDVARLLQETNKLNRRFANLQRRQQQQLQTHHSNQFYGYLPQGPPQIANSLTTSCAQGAPTSNGILKLQLSENSEPFYVHCDEEYMNGGWIIIQNRFTGELNFQRDWSEYKIGFGNLASEFFIGLEKLHLLTSNAVQELVIVLEDFEGEQRYAKYNSFAIGNEAESYALTLLGDYEGNAGDSFTYHAGSKFSTFDNDNDGCVDCNCAQAHNGAWWYNWCEMSNLNGKYYKENETIPRYTGMYWHSFHGPNATLRATRMMIRPVALEQENRR